MLSFLDKIHFATPRLRRIAFWLTSSFLAYVIIGFFILPPIVKSIIRDECEKNLNRTTAIEQVSFNPLTLRFEVDNLTVDKREGEGHFVSVGSFTISPSLSSIWKLAPVISYLHLRNLAVDITFLGEGKFSFSDLIRNSASKQPEEVESKETAEKDETVFPFSLYGFEMTNATITFDDQSHDKKHVISNLNLLVPFTSSFLDLRKEYTQPKFTAVVNGDPVELKGRTLPFDDTLRTEFELGAIDVDLDQYWRYLPMDSPLQLVKGRFTSNISLIFERPDAQSLNLFLDGGGSLTNLELASPKDGKVLALKELSFEMEKFSLGDKELILTSVVMDQPYFKVIRHSKTGINWPDYFPGSTLTKEGAKVQTANTNTPLLLDIRSIEVKAGALEWHDKYIPGGFKKTYPHFTFKGTEVSTHGKRPSKFDISIGNESIVTLSGIASMKPIMGKATLTGKGFNFPAYDPYFKKHLPMIVDSGVAGFSAEIDFQKEGEVISLAIKQGAITIDNLAMRKPDAKEPSIQIAKFAITETALDLKGQTIEVGDITITAPSIKLVKEKSGQLDLVRVFAKEDKETVKEVERDATTWVATINAVHMVEGAAAFKDLALKHPANLSIEGLKVELGNITTRDNATTTYEISTRWGGKGSIALKGEAMLAPLSGKGRLKITGMGLRPFDGHMGEHTELLFASGTASADLKYTFKGGPKPTFTVTGNTALHKVRLKDNRGDGEFAGIDAFKLAGIRFANEPYRLSIADIHLGGPSVAIDFDENGHLNLRRAFRIPEPPPVSEKAEEAAARKALEEGKAEQSKQTAKAEPEAPKPEKKKTFFETIDIGKISMKDGRISFRDATVHPVYYTKIHDMKLGLIEIKQTPDARPKIDFSAKIGPTPMSVTGVFNPAITPIYSDLAIAVNGMELVPLSPYTVQYLAYPVEKGRLYADVKFKTENWVLDANNKFFVEQLVLGPKDKRPDAPSVPVKFGLALLQDSNGDMELNLPIKGRLDNPDFRIGGIVFKAIASLFIKALASPFTLIGSLFGGGEPDMDFVLFEPGRHKLDAAGLKKMEGTIKALKEREKLKLEVDGVIDPMADTSGLVEVIFDDKLKQQKYDSLSRTKRADTSVEAMVIAPEEYEDFLFEAYADEPDEEGIKPTTLFMTDRQPIEFMEKFLLDRIVVTEEDLNELAMRRASSVKDHIVSREASLTERVFLLDRREHKEGKTGVPQHRVDMGIK
ncbi:MAG: DUF748 domain-containing protein [Pseudodesulfovibrio sp.]